MAEVTRLEFDRLKGLVDNLIFQLMPIGLTGEVSIDEKGLIPPNKNMLNAARVGKWAYDFAIAGGAVSTIALTGSVLPSNALVFGGLMEVLTALTSGGAATAAIQAEASDDIIAAAAVSGAPWSTTGRKAIIPVWTAASTKKTTTTRTPSLVIATATLTAGKFNLFLFYVVADS